MSEQHKQNFSHEMQEYFEKKMQEENFSTDDLQKFQDRLTKQENILANFRHDLENNPIRQLTKEEREIYGSGLFAAREMLPSFRDALAVLSPYMDATCTTAYTDRYARVGLSYWFFYLTDRRTKAFVLLHEAMHVLNRHFVRSELTKMKPRMMNFSGDLEINSNIIMLDNMKVVAEDFLLPEKFELPNNKTMEQYASMLSEKLDDYEEKLQNQSSDEGNSENQKGSDGQKGNDQSEDNDSNESSSSSSDDNQTSESSNNQENGQNSSNSENSDADSESSKSGNSDSSSDSNSEGDSDSTNSPAYQSYKDTLFEKEKNFGGNMLDQLLNEKNGKAETGDSSASEGNYVPDDGSGTFSDTSTGSSKGGNQKVKLPKPPKQCDSATSHRSDAADKAGVDKSSIIEQNIARRNTMARMVDELNKSKSRGDGSASDFLKTAISRMSPPKVDWRDVFRKVLATAYSNAMMGRNHVSYKRVNRRYSQGSIIFPGTIDHTPTAMFGVDTSGSMDQSDFKKLMTEIEAILKNGLRSKNSLKVFSVDTTIKNVEPVSSIKNIDLFGGGGTDMSIGFAYVNSLPIKERPNIFILGTDGYTDWQRVIQQVTHATYRSIILVTTKGGYESVPEELKNYAAVIDVSKDD